MSAGVSYAGMAFNFEIMKNLFCLCILLLIGSMQMSRASDKIEKQPLKVLYVGGSADIQVLNETISDSTALRKSIADRTAAFGEMLRQYFQTVKVVAAEDWTPEMSRAYDVTVMDGRPKAIKPAWQEKDASGKVIAYHSAVYLPESFDRPMVTIAEVGNTVGRGIGAALAIVFHHGVIGQGVGQSQLPTAGFQWLLQRNSRTFTSNFSQLHS